MKKTFKEVLLYSYDDEDKEDILREGELWYVDKALYRIKSVDFDKEVITFVKA